MAQPRLNLTILRGGPASPLTKLITGIPFPPPVGFGVGKLEVIEGPGLIGFKLNGTLRWLIDIRRFAGTPSLSTNPMLGGELHIELKGARFPGTELPADLVCVLGKTGLFGTPMDLTLALGGFHAQATIERWLAGQQSLESSVLVGTDVCPLGVTSKLAISGHAQARFFPDWVLLMSGLNLATLSGLGPDIPSDSFALKLLFPGEPSISIHPKSRRTLLAVVAGGNAWHLSPKPTALPIGTLVAADGLFDRIEIDAGEGATGDTTRELVALSSRNDGLTLSVAGGITDLDGNPFALTLANPAYAISFDPTSDQSQGDQTFLTARFGSTPVWLTVDGFALQVGDPGFPPGFEVDTLKGTITSLRCAPALLAVAAPLAAHAGETLSTQPVPPQAPALLHFVTAPGTAPGWGVVAGPEVAGQRRVSVPHFGVSLIRREDLLSLDLLFYNLAVEAGGGSPPQLVVQDPTQPAYLAVRFDNPQNIPEQAYVEGYSDPKNSLLADTFPPVLPTQTLAAGPSRLVFRLTSNSIPYALDSLMDWVQLQQSVVPVALPDPVPPILPLEEKGIVPPGIGHPPPPPPPPPQIRAPADTETAIEVPWHLFLSPNNSGAWAHSKAAVTLSNRTELWHTRLAVRDQQNGQPFANENLPRKIRAIWSPDYSPGSIPGHFDPLQSPPDPNEPFRISLDRNDRDQIVRLSSDFTIPNYQPVSIEAQKLFLTTLGAWMEVFGNWDVLPIDRRAVFSLEQWQHRAAMARDNYVRVVTAGFLLPFGNRASLVKITERKFQPNGQGQTTAFLRQRFFIIVREPLKTYSDLTAVQRRAFPYQNVRITTLVTPNLDPASIKLDATKAYSFMPEVNGSPFLFHVVGQDAEQQTTQTSEFAVPLYFVERGGDYATAVQNYNESGENKPDLAGQKVAFAPSNNSGDTTLHTSTMTFSAQPPNPPPTSSAPFFPQMDGADVVVPAIQQVTGQPGATSIQLYDKYISGVLGPDGFGPGGVFAQIVNPATKALTTLKVGFNGAQSGGVATPNLTVSGLSRKFGTVSGSTPDNIAAGTFTPSDIFQDSGCKLFGVVDLSVLVDALGGGDKTAPVLTTERSSTAITTTLSWSPVLKPYKVDPIEILFDDPNTALSIQAQIVTPFAANPQTSVTGQLQNFTLSLGGVVGIKFDNLSFNAAAGNKLDVAANIHDKKLQFLGDLSFLQTLQDLIPSAGFQDPPSLDVTADGVTAGYTLPIPSVGVGVFSIENISLSAVLTLPFFQPKPLRFRFAFSEREHPFLVSVSLLGGGGFFGIALGPDGVEMLEASIEFGANVSIDVVVASGNVHIMAGVYLKIDPGNNASLLTGYLRAGGSLSVLGLISASVEFYLGFTYFFGPQCSIAGEATVTIEVHVLMFSASVSASLRRQFSDPKASFQDLIKTQQVWDDYCDAFAA